MRVLVTIWALAASTCLGREALVETRGGQSFFGQVALRDGLIYILNAEKNLRVSTSVTNVLWAAFEKTQFLDNILPSRDDMRTQWASSDIGPFLTAGHVEFDPIGRVACTGTNILGSRDAFNFTYQRFRGDREIVVRVLQLPRGSLIAKAGLMVREYLTPEAKNVFIGLQRGRGGVLQAREVAGEETFEAARNDLALPQWLKIRRQGNTFLVLKSGTGHRWTLLDEVTVPMREEVYAGFAASGLTAWPEGANNADRVTFDNLECGTSLPANAFVPSIHLQSGSSISARIDSATTDQILFEGPLPSAPLALAPVSRILFRWVPYRFHSVLNDGRPGLLLANGEFIEGSFRSLDHGRVTISSILFGVRTFDVNHEAMALVLKPLSQKPHAYEVITGNNSKWLASDLELGRSEIVIREPSLGTHHIPIYDLMEIRSVPFSRPPAIQRWQARR